MSFRFRTHTEYLARQRELESEERESVDQVRMAFLSTITLEPLAPYLVVELGDRDLSAVPWFGPFGQIEQQCLRDDSEFYRFGPDVIVVWMRLEEIAEDLLYRFLSLEAEERESLATRIEKRFRDLFAAIRQRSQAPVVVANFAPPDYPLGGFADPHFLEASQGALLQRLNAGIARIASQFAQCAILDFSRIVAEVGLPASYDARMFSLSRMPFSSPALANSARHLARIVRAMRVPNRKCLALDLDNTLWGGIVGDDGIEGIQLGEDYPGNLFKTFQKYVLSLRDSGILLAIVSKNEEATALDAMRNHPDFLLRPDLIAAHRINWTDKATNLREIAAELNIGLDSFVFFDDNPVERDWVRRNCPEVAVIEVPRHPHQYPAALLDSGHFDRVFVTDDDRKRNQYYSDDTRRKQHLQGTSTLVDFLSSLEMTASLSEVTANSLPRCAQLVAKTNQFNLTTQRMPLAEIEKKLSDGSIGICLRLSDKFGDLGLIAFALSSQMAEADHWQIDIFLLSCRAFDRSVETALLKSLSDRILERGGRFLRSDFVPTPRNRVCARFLPDHGFQEISTNSWILALDESNSLKFPEFLTVLENDE